MTSKYKQFDVPYTLRSWQERKSRVSVADLLLPINDSARDLPAGVEADCVEVGVVWRRALQRRQTVIAFLGGHVIKEGLSLHLQDMLRRRWLTHVAGNGAVLVHDYELTVHGATSECVQENLWAGCFGTWMELCELNDAANCARFTREGLGEGTGRRLARSYDQRGVGVIAAAYAASIPFTIHPLLGGDVHHGYADWASLGLAAQIDFRIFVRAVYDLAERGGLFIVFGSAVHAPEVFLKALAWVQNVRQRPAAAFEIAVCDMYPLPSDWRQKEADEDSPDYYYRPWKTLLHRCVPPGGRSHYIQGRHRDVIPALWHCLNVAGGLGDESV